MAEALNNARESIDLVFKEINKRGLLISISDSIALSQTYAAIAQAEQLKRMADAAERQATAAEERNELLIEHNETFAKSVETNKSQRDKMLDKIFGVKNE